jgi:hypothetical protein
VEELGAVFAICLNRMKTAKINRPMTPLSVALLALKGAILEGSTWRYEQLVSMAVKAGATDEQIDLVAHEAIEALFARAEQPITPRNLARLNSAGYFRR